jgi:hypothetical protein
VARHGAERNTRELFDEVGGSALILAIKRVVSLAVVCGVSDLRVVEVFVNSEDSGDLSGVELEHLRRVRLAPLLAVELVVGFVELGDGHDLVAPIQVLAPYVLFELYDPQLFKRHILDITHWHVALLCELSGFPTTLTKDNLALAGDEQGGKHAPLAYALNEPIGVIEDPLGREDISALALVSVDEECSSLAAVVNICNGH